MNLNPLIFRVIPYEDVVLSFSVKSKMNQISDSSGIEIFPSSFKEAKTSLIFIHNLIDLSTSVECRIEFDISLLDNIIWGFLLERKKKYFFEYIPLIKKEKKFCLKTFRFVIDELIKIRKKEMSKIRLNPDNYLDRNKGWIV